MEPPSGKAVEFVGNDPLSPSPGEPLPLLVERHYAAWAGAADLVRRWTELARAATRSARATITPAPSGALRAAAAGSAPARPAAAPSRSPSFPIRYQSADLGTLTLEDPALDPAAAGEAGRELAKTLAFEAMRLELSAAVRERFGREPSWVGPSPALRRLDRFVEQAARSVLPILLAGEEGSQAEAFALALHLASPRAGRRAVQLRCSILEAETLDLQVARFARAAAGGTLILSRLDELAPDCQARLCQLLDAEALGTEETPLSPFEPPVWVATAPAAIDEAAESGRFHRPLLDRLGILRMAIEPLRRRRPDIGFTFQRSFRQLAPARPAALSGEVLDALCAHSWPGDVAELRRVAARLAVMVDEGPVLLSHLRQLTPQVVAGAVHPLPSAPPSAHPAAAATPPEPAPPSPALPPARHPSVRRAFSFLLANYRRKLPLAEVAGHAFVSPSRLAHLFRQDLGATFTQVLARVRIEQAKQLLTSLPWEPITAVAGAVGFADLRHFERVFKLFEGCAPKEFRRLYGERQPQRRKPAPPEPSENVDHVRSETS